MPHTQQLVQPRDAIQCPSPLAARLGLRANASKRECIIFEDGCHAYVFLWTQSAARRGGRLSRMGSGGKPTACGSQQVRRGDCSLARDRPLLHF